MQYAVNVKYNDEHEGQFYLNAILLSKIEVTTNPSKMAYKNGEIISYSGMVVTATYEDDTTKTVTNQCVITPSAGSVFNNNTNVEILYAESQDEKSCYLNLETVTLSSISLVSQPTKTTYNVGEAIDYTGVSVKATYSDGSEMDVTSMCTFDPIAGTAIASDTQVTVSYTESQITQTCSFQLTTVAISSLLEITTMPSTTSYSAGSTISYSGLVVSAVYDDGTKHDVTSYCDFSPADGSTMPRNDLTVTVKCAPPLTTAIYDMNYGYIDSGIWKYENPTNTYIDVYEVQAGHSYYITLGATVGSRFRAMFTTTDVSQSTVNVTGTRIINQNNPSTYAHATYTPATNGYILVAKDNIGVSGLKSYVYDTSATAEQKTEIITFNLEVTELTSITITNPTKTQYGIGEALDYSGCVVTAHYSNDTSKNVTSESVFSPSAGTAYASYMSEVTVSYTEADITMTDSFQISENQLSRIEASPLPRKTRYLEGEQISYSGMVVTAYYSDNSTRDITSDILISPVEGKQFNPQSDSEVTIVYGGQSFSFTLDAVELEITTMPKLNYTAEDNELDYSGIVVKEIYTDGTEIDVTDFCEFNPEEDTLVEEDPTTVTVTCAPILVPDVNGVNGYNVSGGNIWKHSTDYKNYYCDIYGVLSGHRYQLFLGAVVGGYFQAIFTTTNPSTMAERWYSATLVVDKYSPTVNDKSSVFTAPSNGYIMIKKSYGQAGIKTYVHDLDATQKTEETSFDVSLTELSSIGLSAPTKSAYGIGESLDYSGSTVTAFFSNGNTEDVTQKSTFSPIEGTVYSTGIDRVTATYTFGSVSATSSVQLTQAPPTSIEISAQPSRIKYAAGDAISYQGLVVTATYEDSESIDVTQYVSFSAAEGKQFDPATDTTVVISFTESGVTQTCTLTLEEGLPTLDSIAVTTNPKKMSYRYRDVTFDYTGIVVTANYSDGSTSDITNECDFSPVNGQHFDYTKNLKTDISYTENGVEKTCSLSFTRILPVYDGLSLISVPLKTSYKIDEPLDFTGLRVGVLYEDGTTVVLTESAIKYTYSDIHYNNGGIFLNGGHDIEQDSTFIHIVHSTIYVNYTEEMGSWGCEQINNESLSFSLSTITLDYLAVGTHPTKHTYSTGEAIDYTGLVVNAHYTDGTSEAISPKRVKITDSLLIHYEVGYTGYDITPEDGKNFNPSTDKTVTIYYKEEQTNILRSCTLTLNETATGDMVLTIPQLPDMVTYKAGETLDYTGVVAKAHFADGTDSDVDVTDFCEFTPSEGTTIPNGNPIRITAKCPPNLTPSTYDYEIGYVSGGTWTHENPSICRSDIYEVTSGHNYFISLGAVVGTRFRAMFTTVDVTTTQQTSVSGTTIIDSGSPTTYANATFNATANGYIIITKDNVGTSGLKTYVYDKGASKTKTTTFDVGQVGTVASGMELKITKQPNTVEFNEGETLIYTGIEVKGIMHDGTGSELVLSDIIDYPILRYSPEEETPAVLNTTQVSVSCPENLTPYAFDLYSGEVDSGTWKVGVNINHYSDVYEIQAGHRYWIYTGKTVGNVFKVMFTTTDITQSSANVVGTNLYNSTSAEHANSHILITPYHGANGYLVITKTTEGNLKIPTYVFDATGG